MERGPGTPGSAVCVHRGTGGWGAVGQLCGAECQVMVEKQRDLKLEKQRETQSWRSLSTKESTAPSREAVKV